MSSQDPRGRAQTPDELLAETNALLGAEGDDPSARQPAADGTATAGRREIADRDGTPVRGEGQMRGDTAGGAARSGGMSAGMWISLILGAVIVVLLLIFILQNNVPADFQYFGWQFQLPLGVAMLFAAIGGILVAGIIGSVRIFVLGRRLKKIEKATGR
ncbi:MULTISPECIES: lipopolysaccharide assembly protein LapA domain-containing protein [unclassified Brevibacterium]|uniref:LapA family protein n=1 Tax=unclassified Brevibacterium TaxID=2614124 RepID=UPI0010F683E0|nr:MULTISPECIES: lipopolysaccharide assembly protein LapA domain-containing protein [unclassified Brevibacterium]MCM1012089.1 lipopolysaccharide assembly protein LapA domain-containing protein [Brevibacterium sp. XM4083]